MSLPVTYDYILDTELKHNHDSLESTLSANSGNWSSVYTTVSANSANWYNPRRDYGVLSANPTTPAPTDGDVYYNSIMNINMFYDDTRNAWLSDETITIDFGRRGRVNDGQYFRGVDGMAFSSDDGFYTTYSGIIVGMTYTRSNTQSMSFEITSDGNTISGAILPSSTNRGNDFSLSGEFAPNVVLGVRNATGSQRARNVHGTAFFKWMS